MSKVYGRFAIRSVSYFKNFPKFLVILTVKHGFSWRRKPECPEKTPVAKVGTINPADMSWWQWSEAQSGCTTVPRPSRLTIWPTWKPIYVVMRAMRDTQAPMPKGEKQISTNLSASDGDWTRAAAWQAHTLPLALLLPYSECHAIYLVRTVLSCMRAVIVTGRRTAVNNLNAGTRE